MSDDSLVMEAVPPPPIVRAAWANPLDSTLLLALADWVDEQPGGPLNLLDGMRWRMHAEPDNDLWRVAYADILDDLGSDQRLHAEVIRVMCRHAGWFVPKPHEESYRESLNPVFAAALATVATNLDLIAWADLDLQTGPVGGDYIWNRVQAEADSDAGTEGPIYAGFRRGFVCEVSARLGSFLGRAHALWRHPVTDPRCLDRVPWRCVHPEPGLWGWWDVNAVIPSDDDSATLPTELMLAMNDDPTRTDQTLGIRFEPDKRRIGGCCLFGSVIDAQAALRRALVIHGRRAALLPPD